ncbi:TonB-dependent receptor [Pseudomaricurvus alkylphenolicus]|uniref:TonB-dependent receptor n=1 Tax=Pseudomaricurvus alkylphenolicus TaxID=1306991 RepID=UPI0014212A1B|nr:TonB-dependent receptor [Pseudomaricurvus alkylphenolicus]NIB38694.1 TonB-dependent receptor [Pseudomaricurvus alkylphenolicus]
MINTSRKPLFAALSACVAFSPAVCAQTGAEAIDEFQLEEIVVTAERRSQSLQEIPLAVSAISGDTVEKSLVTRTEDLSAAAPGLQISRGRLGEQKLVIRGVGGSVRDNIAASPKVAFFVDDVYIARGAAMDMAFFDLDRVEVLRGPQGTLYGKNAIAGAVNVHSKAPGDTFESKISVNIGNYNQRQTRFMVGGPVSDKFYAKVLAGSNERDGFTDNLTTDEELSLEESYFGRATLVYEGDAWDLRATFDYENNPSNPGTAMHIVGSSGYDILNLGGALGTITYSPDDRYDVTLDEDGEGSQTSQGFSFKATHSGENIVFDSITGYRDVKNSFARDIDNSPSAKEFDIRPIVDPTWHPGLLGPDYTPFPSTVSVINMAADDSWSVSQEFRISSVDDGGFSLGGSLFWTAGLYLFHDEGERIEDFHIDMPGVGVAVRQKQTMELEGDTLALYGQGTYTVTDDFDIVVGLRYSYEKKEAVHGASDVFPTLVQEPFSDAEIEESWTQITPKITATYQISQDTMLYATYSKGSLGGGFNFGPESALIAATESFDQEEAHNFEIGIKGSAFNSRFQYSATAFYIDYQDLQVQGISSTGATTTENAATATSQGIEFEATALVADGLTLSANYAYVDAEFNEYCEGAVDETLKGTACTDAGGMDHSGNRLEYSSQDVFNFSAEYVMPVSDKGELVFSTSYTYNSEQFFDPLNNAGQGSFDIINAHVAYESADGHWFLSLWGKNLNGQEYNRDFIGFGQTSDGAAYVQGAPRTYGATVTWTY